MEKISFSVPKGWTLYQVLTVLGETHEVNFLEYTDQELNTILPPFKVEDVTWEEALETLRGHL